MPRSYNDMEKLMDLFLYLFPKYLERLSDQQKNREVMKMQSFKEVKNKTTLREADKKNKKDFISKEQALRNNQNLGEREKDKTSKQANGEEEEKKHSKQEMKNKDQLKDGDCKIEDKSKVALEKKITTESKADENITTENKCCDYCTNDMGKILRKLIGEKVDICTTGSSVFLLNSATIVSVEDSIVKLKTIRNTKVVIPIHEIVGIRSDSIYSIKFNSYPNSDGCEKFCIREQSLRKYFGSIIGKRVFLQTKGGGEFKYINNRIITGVGRGVVLIEGTVAISLCKIILIEEVM